LAQLIVLDASVAIAALSADDGHHRSASGALAALTDADLVLAATSGAEILVGPMAAGGSPLAVAKDFVDGCETVPVTASLADDAAALRAQYRALSLPDAIALVVATLIDADAVWTFDRSWIGIDPASHPPMSRGCRGISSNSWPVSARARTPKPPEDARPDDWQASIRHSPRSAAWSTVPSGASSR
jgi:predicted nucleic acid-binding protein